MLDLQLSEAADRLGVSRVTLSRVLHEHARISPGLAIRLEEAGVGTARHWLAMQTTYDLAMEARRDIPHAEPTRAGGLTARRRKLGPCQ